MRGATEALSKRDLDRFFGYQADDVVDPEVETHDMLASDDHAVVLNTVRASRAGQILEQEQVVVIHIKDGKITETWLQFSEQQAMDEMSS